MLSRLMRRTSTRGCKRTISSITQRSTLVGTKAGVTDMHAHIIVSRKDRSNTIKLSPKTNHRNTGKGAVKGGFDRTEFFRKCETGFDLRTNYRRDVKESFEYLNAMKNGTPAEIKKQASRAVQYQARREAEKEITNKVVKKIVKGIGGRGL